MKGSNIEMGAHTMYAASELSYTISAHNLLFASIPLYCVSIMAFAILCFFFLASHYTHLRVDRRLSGRTPEFTRKGDEDSYYRCRI